MALSVAVHESARNQVEMSRMLGCDRTVMVYLLDELVGEGLVERRPDPADRRNRLIVATDKGRERLKAVNEAIADAEDSLLAPLDPAEREQLRTIMGRVVAHRLGGAEGQAGARDACQTAEAVLDAPSEIC
jgi:DNA-binding MarR family transcriptional regulator